MLHGRGTSDRPSVLYTLPKRDGAGPSGGEETENGTMTRETTQKAYVAYRRRRFLQVGWLCATAVAAAAHGEPPATPIVAPPSVVDDINREFLNPELNPDEWLAKFEIESREVFAARKEIIAAVGLEPGDRIADVGSGTGLYLAAFSAAVGPAGRVYAVDISPRLTEFIERRIRDEKLGNVATVRSTPTSTTLQPDSVTHAFVCDAYHHFDRYPEMLASIHAALQPGGELVVVDFDRIPGVSREWLLTHVRADKNTVRKEIEAADFRFVEDVPVAAFKENYLLRFRKPRSE